MSYESNGTLTTSTKSFSNPQKPNLSGLVYSLNSQSASVDVVGSPGTTSEERISVTLDGSTSYTIYDQWADTHTDYRLQFQLSSDGSSTPSVDEVDLTGAIAYESGSVTATISFSVSETVPAKETGAVASTASVDAKETAPARESSTTNVTSFVSATESAPARETGVVNATTTVNGAEYVTMKRTPTIQGDGRNTAMQTLSPVFPDERALDVQWDFNSEFMGFASEWLAEDSIINHEVRDGLGVVIGGDLSTTIEVFIQYDKTGDGVADVTSEIKDLSEAYHTLAFDDNELFGEDGWYRVIVRGLRTYDTVNQLDIGAVHENL
jgi:hypothetical protein